MGHDTWPKDAWKYSGAANDWTGFSLDEKRGLVFAFDWLGRSDSMVPIAPAITFLPIP